MKTCPLCEKENTDKAVFCSGCGERFAAPASEAVCPACGYNNTACSAFCAGCGTPLSIKAPVFYCPNCGATVSDDQTLCTVCGCVLPQHTVQAAAVAANIPYYMQNDTPITAPPSGPFPFGKAVLGWAGVLLFYIMLCIIV